MKSQFDKYLSPTPANNHLFGIKLKLLSNLKQEIERILQKWKYNSSTKFLEHSKDGTLSEAEEDAIILKNLQD